MIGVGVRRPISPIAHRAQEDFPQPRNDLPERPGLTPKSHSAATHNVSFDVKVPEKYEWKGISSDNNHSDM